MSAALSAEAARLQEENATLKQRLQEVQANTDLMRADSDKEIAEVQAEIDRAATEQTGPGRNPLSLLCQPETSLDGLTDAQVYCDLHWLFGESNAGCCRWFCQARRTFKLTWDALEIPAAHLCAHLGDTPCTEMLV